MPPSVIGEGPDEVRIILGDKQTFVVEQYEITQGVLTQPAAFAVTLGHGLLTRDLMQQALPGTPFELLVGGRRQFKGSIDGWVANDGGSGTSLAVRGRDAMAPLVDAFVRSEKSYEELTYAEFTTQVLKDALGDRPFELIYSNAANRKTITGSNTSGSVTGERASAAKKSVHAKLGERYYDGLLKPELDRAGLFLWASADGIFILTEPDTKQPPTYKIKRRRGITIDDASRGESEVISASFTNDASRRYAGCIVHGRKGGGEESRARIEGKFPDAEMARMGFDKFLVFADDQVKTIKQAEYLAQRKIAEARREAWKLEYTVAGHTTNAIDGGKPVVWAPDTVVDIEDDEFGITGRYYLENVTKRRGPEATTVLRFMRLDDVVFGEEPPAGNATAASANVSGRSGATVVASYPFANLFKVTFPEAS